MSIPKNCNFSDYTHYSDEESPTTDAQMMDYFQNQNTLLKNLCTRLWQPQTTYNKGDIVFSPSMSNGLIAVCSSAGTSAASAAEPTWGALESTVVDGTATWTMKIAYSGDITNTTGTLPISRGGTGQTTAAAARNALGLGNTTGAVPIANGGTGATTAAAARNALGLGNTTGALPIANGGTGATTAAAACKNLNAIGYRSNIGSIKSIPGSFWADNASGINADEVVPFFVDSKWDWMFLQLGALAGYDKIQFCISSDHAYFRYDDAVLGNESWTAASWVPLMKYGKIPNSILESGGGYGITAQSLGTNGYVKFANGLIIQWGYYSQTLSKGKTGDWAFPNSISVSFTYPISMATTYAIIPMCERISATTEDGVNLGAFYSNATTTGFTHWSSISWECTVVWTPCYVAIGKV